MLISRKSLHAAELAPVWLAAGGSGLSSETSSSQRLSHEAEADAVSEGEFTVFFFFIGGSESEGNESSDEISHSPLPTTDVSVGCLSKSMTKVESSSGEATKGEKL